MTTEPVDSSAELSNQIARLMAALTRSEQGNCPVSAPNSPRHRGHWRGKMDRNTPAQALTMAELAWLRPPLPAVPLLAMAKALPPLEPKG